MKKILITTSIILISFFLSGCSAKEAKYQSCIEACEKNNACIEKIAVDKDAGGYASSVCSKWSSAECKTVCVQKYK